jgi:hemolysin activation/secretion protein
VASILAVPASAQVIERYAPQVPQTPPAPLALPDLQAQEQDATPIGPNLTGITLLDRDEAAKTTPDLGIDLGKISRLAPVAAEVQAELKPYLGQPISRKMIAEVQTRLTQRYRALGYPFVSVFTPEQDISGGVLQFQIVEFRIGAISLDDKDKGRAASALDRLGVKTGDAINAKVLTENLYWLNLYPFTQTQPIFTPSATPGQTDLKLVRTASRPWQVYTGYENSGSPGTSWGRYFVGASLGNVFGYDSVLSYQATSSADALSAKAYPKYIGQVVNYALPVGHHGRIELGYNHVQTYQTSAPFTVQLKIDELELAYAFGISRLFHDGMTQMRLGLAGKRVGGQTLFYDYLVYEAQVDDPQVSAAITHSQASAGSATNWSMGVRALPGGISKVDDPGRGLLYRQGQSPSAHYTYFTANFGYQTQLRGPLVWRSQFIGQWAEMPLPRTEQAGLGGSNLVRGYNLDDGAYDQVAVWRNELALSAPVTLRGVNIGPFVFNDIGIGRDLYARTSLTIASVGIGSEMALDPNLSLKLTVATGLLDGPSTREMNGQAHIGLSRRF